MTRRTLVSLPLLLPLGSRLAAQSHKWPEEKANDWYSRQPWLVGSNFIPVYASNQLEMWQADTFDPDRINFELGWAESIGMNTMRVFLHDLLWKMDSAGVSAPHRQVSLGDQEASDPSDFRFVRFLLGSFPGSGASAAAAAGDTQLPVGAKPGRNSAGRSRNSRRAFSNTPRMWCWRSPRTIAYWPGTCGTNRTT